MPIHQARCETCNHVFDFVLMSQKKASAWKEELAQDLVWCDLCEVPLVRQMERISVHSHSGGYPFTTAPWLLPPKYNPETGKHEIQQEYISNRADLIRLRKKHGLVGIETESDKLTMYGNESEKAYAEQRRMDNEVDKDLKMYNEMLRNPRLRQDTIRKAVMKRDNPAFGVTNNASL